MSDLESLGRCGSCGYEAPLSRIASPNSGGGHFSCPECQGTMVCLHTGSSRPSKTGLQAARSNARLCAFCGEKFG